MRKNKFKETGNKGIIAGWIIDKVIAIKLWKAILILILMTIGVVFIVARLLDSIERVTLNRVDSGITEGIKNPKGKFWISKTISVTPDYPNTGRIRIARTGDQHLQKENNAH